MIFPACRRKIQDRSDTDHLGDRGQIIKKTSTGGLAFMIIRINYPAKPRQHRGRGWHPDKDFLPSALLFLNASLIFSNQILNLARVCRLEESLFPVLKVACWQLSSSSAQSSPGRTLTRRLSKSQVESASARKVRALSFLEDQEAWSGQMV